MSATTLKPTPVEILTLEHKREKAISITIVTFYEKHFVNLILFSITGTNVVKHVHLSCHGPTYVYYSIVRIFQLNVKW